jgi:hypothetical protein
MNNHTLWSYDSDIQRNKRRPSKKLGLKLLEQSLPLHLMQTFLILENSPKPSVNIKTLRNKLKNASPEQVKEIRKQEGQPQLMKV